MTEPREVVEETHAEPAFAGQPVGLRLVWRKISRRPTAVFGMVVAVAMVFAACFAEFIEPYDPLVPQLRERLHPPYILKPVYDQFSPETSKLMNWDSRYWFGTDRLGRDILSRIIRGARISLIIGVLATTLASFIGLLVGALSGYFGGRTDTLLMRLADIILAFPYIILLSAIMAIVRKPELWVIFMVLGVVGWAGISRLVRAQVLVTKEMDYVAASRALGAGHARVLFLHVLPNCISPVVIWFTMGIASAIMAESSLSFLGLGVEQGTPSWGAMIADGFQDFTTAWWQTFFPGVALALAVLGFNLLGDALQDAINPRLK